jgi:hypothetical protein
MLSNFGFSFNLRRYTMGIWIKPHIINIILAVAEAVIKIAIAAIVIVILIAIVAVQVILEGLVMVLEAGAYTRSHFRST